MLAWLGTSVGLMVLAGFLTQNWRHLMVKYSDALKLTATELRHLDVKLRRTSLAARLLALCAPIPVGVDIALRAAPALVNKTIYVLGIAVTAGIALVAVRLIGKIPFRTLWNPALSWPRQICLVLFGGLAATAIPAIYVLLSQPDVRSQVLERLFGK